MVYRAYKSILIVFATAMLLATPALAQDDDGGGDSGNSGGGMTDGRDQNAPEPSAIIRSQMEDRMNTNIFDDVRVHTDNEAADTATNTDARAFTHGNDIYLGNARGERGDRRLLAEELSHTLQQRSSTSEAGGDETDETSGDGKPEAEEDGDRQRRIDPNLRPRPRY